MMATECGRINDVRPVPLNAASPIDVTDDEMMISVNSMQSAKALFGMSVIQSQSATRPVGPGWTMQLDRVGSLVGALVGSVVGESVQSGLGNCVVGDGDVGAKVSGVGEKDVGAGLGRVVTGAIVEMCDVVGDVVGAHVLCPRYTRDRIQLHSV